MNKPTIFISSGLRTGPELDLANELCDVVREVTSFEPWCAGNLTELRSLASRIYDGLAECEGLISVLHRRTDRGAGTGPGPLWVEQELAIAAFLHEHLGKPMRVLRYAEEGVERAGLRTLVPDNLVSFREPHEVIDHARRELPSWTPQAAWPVSVELRMRAMDRRSDRHVYRCEAIVRNHGFARLMWHEVRVQVPRLTLERSVSYASLDKRRSTPTTEVFVQRWDRPLAPHDEQVSWESISA